MNKSVFAGLFISLSIVIVTTLSVQTANASSMFESVNRCADGKVHVFGCDDKEQQEPEKYPPPTLDGEPVCTVDRPCSVETQEDAENLIREHPGAVVYVDPGDEYGDEEQSNNDDQETDEQDSGDGENSNNEVQSQQQEPQPLTADPSGQGLFDACLQTPGMTPQKCSNYLGSTDVGNYCTTLTIAGVPCPEIQDPDDTYRDPEGALEESNQKIDQTESAIEGFNRLYPPGSLGGEFAGPGSTTNRPGQ